MESTRGEIEKRNWSLTYKRNKMKQKKKSYRERKNKKKA